MVQKAMIVAVSCNKRCINGSAVNVVNDHQVTIQVYIRSKHSQYFSAVNDAVKAVVDGLQVKIRSNRLKPSKRGPCSSGVNVVNAACGRHTHYLFCLLRAFVFLQLSFDGWFSAVNLSQAIMAFSC